MTFVSDTLVTRHRLLFDDRYVEGTYALRAMDVMRRPGERRIACQ